MAADAETLAARIARLRHVPVGELAAIGRQIADQLAGVHRLGAAHRGIAPDRIVLGDRATLLDASGVTPPAYRAPEQWQTDIDVDGRADVYALGCVLFEAAAGRPPFVFDTVDEARAKHVAEPAPRVRGFQPMVPRDFDELVARMLAKAPAARPALTEVAAALRAIEIREGGASPPQRAAPIAAAPAPAVAAASVGVAVEPMRPRRPAVAPAASVPRMVAAPKRAVRANATRGVAIGGLLAAVVAIIGISAAVQSSSDEPNEQLAVSPPPVPEPPVPPRPVPSPPAPAAPDHPSPPIANPDNCDEVSCVLGNYAQPCCARFHHSPPPPSPTSPPSASDSLARADIVHGVEKIRGRILACGYKSNAHGAVRVHVAVAPAGTVSQVTVSTTPDPELGNCVAHTMEAAVFAKTKLGGTFAYPFVF